jgi:hypothetical protein
MSLIYVYVWGLLLLLATIWLLRGRPEKESINKYPKIIMNKAHFPFGKNWETHVEKDDIEIFKANQFRIKVWYLVLVLPPLAFYLYLNLKIFL